MGGWVVVLVDVGGWGGGGAPGTDRFNVVATGFATREKVAILSKQMFYSDVPPPPPPTPTFILPTNLKG